MRHYGGIHYHRCVMSYPFVSRISIQTLFLSEHKLLRVSWEIKVRRCLMCNSEVQPFESLCLHYQRMTYRVNTVGFNEPYSRLGVSSLSHTNTHTHTHTRTWFVENTDTRILFVTGQASPTYSSRAITAGDKVLCCPFGH
jgi:hypothetical protein